MKPWAALVLAVTLASGCGRLRALRGESTDADPVAAPTGSAAAPAAPWSTAQSAGRAADAGAPPEGYVEVTVLGVLATAHGNAVLLLDDAAQRVLPIFVGGTEALSIELRFDGRRYQRPLTHDLLDTMVLRLGGEHGAVQVDELRDSVFVGSVHLRDGDRVIEIDARPSDAIALALGSRAPIYVARKVLDEGGVPAAQVVRKAPDGSETLELPAPRASGRRASPMEL